MSPIQVMVKRYIAVLLILGLSCAYGADSEYSNIQAGVRMRVLNYDQTTPTLRIENKGRKTLAIHNDVSLGVSFYEGSNKVSALPNVKSPSGVTSPWGAVRVIERNSNQVAIIGPGACLEVPLRNLYFNLYEEGYGVSKNWEEGLKLVPPGTYSVRYTTNCRGITVLNVNTTPFRVNFDIPPFTLTVN